MVYLLISRSNVPIEKLMSSHPWLRSLPGGDTWAVLVYRDNGSLEIYSLPPFGLVFASRNFSSSPHTITDSGPVSLSR